MAASDRGVLRSQRIPMGNFQGNLNVEGLQTKESFRVCWMLKDSFKPIPQVFSKYTL